MPTDPGLLAVALYAGLSTLIGLWLAVHVGRKRGELKIMMGDGGDLRMVRAMRGQANFVETVPFALLLLLMMALMQAPAWAIHLLGIVLILGRVLHALHFTADEAPQWQRSVGAALTFLVMSVGAIGVTGHALLRLF
ncbi:MAG TPA: MAPEG family protein [Paracoccaceae bacterium]|nr:MAPEG family protein [Paracoccaceae bacterium]